MRVNSSIDKNKSPFLSACHGGWKDLRSNGVCWQSENQHGASGFQFPPPASDLLLEPTSEDSSLVLWQAAERESPGRWEQC